MVTQIKLKALIAYHPLVFLCLPGQNPLFSYRDRVQTRAAAYMYMIKTKNMFPLNPGRLNEFTTRKHGFDIIYNKY